MQLQPIQLDIWKVDFTKKSLSSLVYHLPNKAFSHIQCLLHEVGLYQFGSFFGDLWRSPQVQMIGTTVRTAFLRGVNWLMVRWCPAPAAVFNTHKNQPNFQILRSRNLTAKVTSTWSSVAFLGSSWDLDGCFGHLFSISHQQPSFHFPFQDNA